MNVARREARRRRSPGCRTRTRSTTSPDGPGAGDTSTALMPSRTCPSSGAAGRNSAGPTGQHLQPPGDTSKVRRKRAGTKDRDPGGVANALELQLALEDEELLGRRLAARRQPREAGGEPGEHARRAGEDWSGTISSRRFAPSIGTCRHGWSGARRSSSTHHPGQRGHPLRHRRRSRRQSDLAALAAGLLTPSQARRTTESSGRRACTGPRTTSWSKPERNTAPAGDSHAGLASGDATARQWYVPLGT